MNHVFEVKEFFTVRDGTDVAPFMNAMDPGQRELHWGSLGEMSVAAGRLGPEVTSSIHFHPVVTQITYVVSGLLGIWMKEPGDGPPYRLSVSAGQAALTRPGTLLQLENLTPEPVEVLYINSPPWLFEAAGDELIYDDAVIVAKTWEELEAAKYNLASMRVPADQVLASRNQSLRRVERSKQTVTEAAHA